MRRSFRASAMLGGAAIVGAIFGLESTAHAWKPLTHVYLAQQAWEDAKDGRVTFFLTRYAEGKVTSTRLGDFEVDPTLLASITQHPDKYFAGVLGPDAYPDIMTGQMRIHPPAGRIDNAHNCNNVPTGATPYGPATGWGPDTDCNGAGTDAWLSQLWSAAWASPGASAEKAWVAGFFAHAAGDMYAHTFMNNYTGGIFNFLDENGIKHIVLEGYVAERTPQPEADIFAGVKATGVDGIERFIADNTRDVAPNDEAETGKKYSLPSQLDRLEAGIRAAMTAWGHDADAIYAQWQGNVRERDRDSLISYCSDFFHNDPARCGSVMWEGRPIGHDAARSAEYGARAAGAAIAAAFWQAAYWAHDRLGIWIPFAHDTVIPGIDRARVDWIRTSHRVAIDMFFSSKDDRILGGHTNWSHAGRELKEFAETFVFRVLGADDNVVKAFNDFLHFKDSVTDYLSFIKSDLMDMVLWKPLTLGRWGKDDVMGMFERPHAYLNQVFSNNPPATAISVQSADVMMSVPTITNPTDWGTDENVHRFAIPGAAPPVDGSAMFPPAWNTVQMIKLSLLSPSGLNALVSALHAQGVAAFDTSASPPQNAMLGFIKSIDSSNQWAEGPRMFLARDCVSYQKVFLKQSQPGARGPWEPTDSCGPGTMPLQFNPLPPYAPLLGGRSLSLATNGHARFSMLPSIGVLRTTGANQASYSAPPQILHDQTVVVTATASDGTGRSAHAAIRLRQDLRILVTRDANAPPGSIREPFLRPGESRRLALAPAMAGQWRVVSGPGRMGDDGKGTSERLKNELASHGAEVARADAAVRAAVATHAGCGAKSKLVTRAGVVPIVKDARCAVAFQSSAAAEARRDELVKSKEASMQKALQQLASIESTYFAPQALARQETAVIEARAADGRVARFEIDVVPPPPALTGVKIPASVRPGETVVLRLSEDVPMTWTVAGGDVNGKMGDPAQRAQIMAQTVTPFRAKLDEIHAQKKPMPAPSKTTALHHAELEAHAAASLQNEQAIASHIRANAQHVGEALVRVHTLDSTFHAPVGLSQPRTVTLNGTAADGRTVTVQIHVLPK